MAKWSKVRPDIPDNWKGGMAETQRVLGGIDFKTLDKYAKLGKRNGGIDSKLTLRGRQFIGKEVKRFWDSL